METQKINICGKNRKNEQIEFNILLNTQ